uniref:tetratricopeptide repeat protein n=1 Tax=Altererythrobacter segetis TaxID=1104773 RepID=UPI00140A2855|nr:cytochrome C biosynthesis protein [Altererythrobacter segetis]
MIWALVLGLAAVAFATMALLFRLPRPAWTTALTALALGLAGYAAQGSPEVPGAPKVAAPLVEGEGANLVELRRAVLPSEQWSHHNAVIIADGLARRDKFADAATFLLGAVRDDAKDGEAWLALGNNLVAQADGAMTPAAQFAYRRAEAAAPQSPGVPFFVGVYQLEAGNFLDARGLWAEAAHRAPEGSEARLTIESRIARLDAVMQQMLKMQQSRQPGAATK